MRDRVGSFAAPIRPAAHPIRVPFRYDSAAFVAAATLLILAVAIPPRATAGMLVVPHAQRFESIVVGVWVFKLLLALHAGLLLLARRILAAPAHPLIQLDAPEHRPGWHLPALLAVIFVGVLARALHLNDGLWLDEITTLIDYVRQPFAHNLTLFASKNHHVLFSLLARGSVLVFGDSAWALRLPAALFGVLSLPALYWFASLIVTRREALFATAIMAVSYHHVWFSQNARGYTGMLLFTILGTGLFLKLLARTSERSWPLVLGYAAVMAAAVYTHLTAAGVVIGHAVVLLVLSFRRWTWSSWRELGAPLFALLLAGTFSLQLYAVVLPQVMTQLFPAAAAGAVAAPTVRSGWRDPLWMVTETVSGLSRGLPGGWIALVLGMFIAILGTVRVWRRSAVAAGLMLGPPLLMGGTLVAAAHQLWPRFFFFAAGFGVLIATAGVHAAAELVGRHRAPLLSSAALAAVVLLSAGMVPRAWGPKQDYEGAAAFVESIRDPADAVVTYGPKGRPFQRYLGLNEWRGPLIEPTLARVEATHPRTWVVYYVQAAFKDGHEHLWRRLQTQYRPVASFPGTLGGGTIYVVVKE